MARLLICRLLLGACAVTLAGCGGGGGGGVASLPPPPVAPPPPPPSATQAVLNVFPGITTTTEFATLGYEVNRSGPQALTADGFSVRYDGPSGVYVMDVPATPAGTMYQYLNVTQSATWYYGSAESGGNWLSLATVLRPSNPELELTYTTLVNYDSSGMSPEPFGWFAFGSATPAAGVPLSGTATYAALVRGSSFDGNGYIRGTASLEFDFGAGELSGHFDPEYLPIGGIGDTYSLGRYDFANTVFGVGSASFSGDLVHSSQPNGGTFNGLFTGPGAQELMARWTTSFRDPLTNQDSEMFGVWVGRR